MSVVGDILQNAAVGVAVADRPDDLKAFVKPGCAAAIWRRQPCDRLQAWVGHLDPATLPQGRRVVHRTQVRATVVAFCEASQTPPGAGRDDLIDNIEALSELFADLMNARYLRLRLDVVSTNACRKFHIDAITARLVCTYRGTGTQYGISRDGEGPKRVFTTPTGAPILLRGRLWPEKPASGLLHRSPPIEGTGETRLVLVLDPIFDSEDAI